MLGGEASPNMQVFPASGAPGSDWDHWPISILKCGEGQEDWRRQCSDCHKRTRLNSRSHISVNLAWTVIFPNGFIWQKACEYLNRVHGPWKPTQVPQNRSGESVDTAGLPFRDIYVRVQTLCLEKPCPGAGHSYVRALHLNDLGRASKFSPIQSSCSHPWLVGIDTWVETCLPLLI